MKQKKLKWILNFSLLMTEDRLKTYIETLDVETSCKEFIDVNTKILNEIKKNPKFVNQLKIHRALSNIKRFLILKILEAKPMCTCALANLFDATDGAITHHLKILEGAGLIVGKKQGYYTIYYTKESLIEQIQL
jgi:predicted transcriptional regulator